jgi:hypothetical protein
MAVVARPRIQTKLDFWGTADSGIYPLESPEQMTTIMSYQYPPPPPPNGAEMDMSHPGYMQNYNVPPQTSSTLDMRSAQDLKDRRDSLAQANLKLKRSLSTPNVRPQQPPDHTPLGMSAEKRRNKLGYHRTSVACGKSFFFSFYLAVFCTFHHLRPGIRIIFPHFLVLLKVPRIARSGGNFTSYSIPAYPRKIDTQTKKTKKKNWLYTAMPLLNHFGF